jgi:hypothetical protein
MKNTFTIPKFLLLFSVFTLWVFQLSAQNRAVFAPWCQSIRYNYSSGYYGTCIDEVSIKVDDNDLFYKAKDGLQYDNTNQNGNHGHVLNTENNPVQLVAGGTYKLFVGGSENDYWCQWGYKAWIDYDLSYTFEAGEVLSSQGYNSNTSRCAGQYNEFEPGDITFTIPCDAKSGITRLRIICSYSAANIQNAQACNENAGTWIYTYGETEDIYIDIVRPSLLAADFFVPSFIWAGAPTTIFNRFPREGSYSWDKGAGIDFRGDNYQTIFSRSGEYDVTLIATNCLGTTSITKKVKVFDVPQEPVADFVSSRNIITEGDEITLYDLSLYGPSRWDWEITNFDMPNYLQTHDNAIRGLAHAGSYYQPVFRFHDVGEFNVKMTSFNLSGANMKGKPRYIHVEPFSDFILGIGVTQTELGSGRILDNGGIDNDYKSGPLDGSPNRNRLLIKPCGAEAIRLTIDVLKFGNNAHTLRVWDGDSKEGIPIHADSGFTNQNTVTPVTVVATSGAMYMEFDATASGTSEGLVARFETTFGTTNPPLPYFEQIFPSVAYTKSEVFFKGGVSNLFGLSTVKWTVDRFEVPASYIKGDQMSYEFLQAGEYNVCLEVKSCAGDTNFCRKIQVVDPTGRTTLDFKASDDRPELGQNVVLQAITDKANRFQWNVVPATYSVNAGSMRAKYPNISFNRPGTYSVSLRAWNTFDSSASTRFLVKNNYIIVIDPCTPLAFESSTDVTNNRLRVFDRNNQVIFSHSSLGGDGYRSFLNSGDPVVNLTFGATYDIEMFRETAADTVSRSIFIDFNSNGVFEASEMVLFERNTLTQRAISRFKVPGILDAYNGTTRLRTIVTYGDTDPLNPCGPGLLAEYKDYRVSLNQSSVLPVISLIGKDTIEIEVGSIYNDEGATAFDAIDGDITADISSETNVDFNQAGIYFTKFDVINSSGVNAATKVRQIFVFSDRTAPVLQLIGPSVDTIEVNTEPYLDPMGFAFDNIDGDISSEIKVIGKVDHTEIGEYVLRYEVSDVQGNLSVAHRTVHVLDRTAPQFHFTTSTRLQLGKFWYDQTTVSDNYWPVDQIAYNMTFGVNGPVRWDIPGEYPITYSAVDGSGNRNEVIRVYEVRDFVAPVIFLHTPDTISHHVFQPYTRIEPTVSDNITPVSRIQFTYTSNVDPNVVGLYEERYTAIDEDGNINVTSRFVKVIDVVPPMMSGSSFCTKLGFEFNPMFGITITDNYYSEETLLPLVKVISNNVNIWLEGYYSIVYAVVDPSGNRSNFLNRNVQISADCELITSVDQVSAGALTMVNVVPNPSTGILNIQLKDGRDYIQTVEVLSAVGQLVQRVETGNVSQTSIDITQEATGIYLIRVKTVNGHSMTTRVIKTD